MGCILEVHAFKWKGTDLKTENLMCCFMRKWQTFMHDSTFKRYQKKTMNDMNDNNYGTGLKISGTSFSAS